MRTRPLLPVSLAVGLTMLGASIAPAAEYEPTWESLKTAPIPGR
ncbi:MAG: hypothetical protein PVH68_20935 [Armatimonadota bacterium]|jgi:hypothetical protein